MRFSCDSCGRQFRWKTEIAGKRVKCVCGQPVSVPASVDGKIEEQVYAFREEPPRRVVMIAPPSQTQPPPAQPAALGYAAPVQIASAPIDPLRDLWIPAATVLLAAIALSLPTGTHASSAMRLLAFFWLFMSITTLPVLGGVVLYGVVESRQLDISVKSFGVAALKLAAIILVTDAVVFLLFDFFRSIGAFDTYSSYSTNKLVGLLILFGIICVMVVIKSLATFFFRRGERRFAAVAVLLSAGAWIAHLFLASIIFIATVVTAVGRANRTVAPMVTGPAPLTAAIGTSAPALPALTAKDHEILQAASQGLVVIEGREWKRSRANKSPAIDLLIESLYSSGADKVYIDLRNGGMSRPAIAYVQLPIDPAASQKCLAVYQVYAAQGHLPMVSPATGRFTTLPLTH